MTVREADTAFLQRMHNATKRARSIPDETTRAALLADLVELDRLHSIRLTADHDAAIYRREVESVLKKS